MDANPLKTCISWLNLSELSPTNKIFLKADSRMTTRQKYLRYGIHKDSPCNSL